jgi:CTP:molybdopterin cytidylyltransferase MocA
MKRIPLTGIILAAGPGTRFGGPKALASFGDENCVTMCTRKLLDTGLADVVVVTGASSDEVNASIQNNRLDADPALRTVFDPGWVGGMGSGIAAGLARAAPAASGALLWPVHFPLVAQGTVELLGQLFCQEPGNPGKVMVPLFEGRYGMPVMVGRDLWREFNLTVSDDPLTEIARAVPARTIGVGVDDPGTVFAIITRDDFMRAMQIISEEEYATPHEFC